MSDTPAPAGAAPQDQTPPPPSPGWGRRLLRGVLALLIAGITVAIVLVGWLGGTTSGLGMLVDFVARLSGGVVTFEKADDAGRFVRGFASVISVEGKPVEDWQGDVIEMGELRKAAHRYVTDARVAKAMHAGSQVGEVVESVIIDDAFAKAVGMSDTRRGWWIGMRVNDPAIQKRVAAGELKAFSIGGKGKRKKLEGC